MIAEKADRRLCFSSVGAASQPRFIYRSQRLYGKAGSSWLDVLRRGRRGGEGREPLPQDLTPGICHMK
jgi:hypothetical protein